jgi:predicted dehydrogenase
LKGIIEVEDSCGGRVLFENGKLANFYATNACVSFDTNTIFLKTKNHKIEIISPARLYVDGEEIELEKHQNYVGKECYGVGHFTVIKKFYTSIFENSEVPVTLKSAQYALKLLLAAYRSGGEEVTIEY